MIRTKELMIGNWVYENEKSQFPMYVIGVFKDVAYLDFEDNEADFWEVDEKDLAPIPLTEEIFTKNSFECLAGVYYLKQYSDTEFCKNYDGRFYMTANLGECNCIEKPIEYVHQLQNILTIAGIDIDFKI